MAWEREGSGRARAMGVLGPCEHMQRESQGRGSARAVMAVSERSQRRMDQKFQTHLNSQFTVN